MIETCVHPGTGLAEWSALVVKGKEEEERRKELIEEESLRDKLAAIEKELEARGGRNAHSRNGSVAGSVLEPTSPILQWMGRRAVVEQD